MNFLKIHAAGSDYIVLDAAQVTDARPLCRLLDRHTGIGGEGILLVGEPQDGCAAARLFTADGREGGSCATAAMAAARALYDRGACGTAVQIALGGVTYPVRLTVLGARVLCVWTDLAPLLPRPMDQLKYYYGIRGEVLRACLPRPRLSIVTLGGTHAVFLLESPAALRAPDLDEIRRRLYEVLFYGEDIRMHFAAVSGDNALSVRSFLPRCGETAACGEGAVAAAGAAQAASLCDGMRTAVRMRGGSFCVELCGKTASLCAKCERVFAGEVG